MVFKSLAPVSTNPDSEEAIETLSTLISASYGESGIKSIFK